MPSCAVGRHATSSAAGSADGEAALRSDGEEGEEDEVLDVGALTLPSETAHSHVKTSMQDRDAAPRVEASDSMVLLTQASEAELQSHSSHTAWHGNSEVPGLSHRQAVAIAQITGPALGGGRGSSERQGGDLGEELPLMRGPGEENVEAEPGWAARRRPVSASPGSREMRLADARWHGGMGSAIGVMPGVQEECEEDGASGNGQQEVVGERRQVIKAAIRSLVQAARPDLSPAQVDAVVAEMNKRMTMGSKQCCLTAVLCLSMLLQSFMGQRIGESTQRPLELCSWKDREALPPIGKEYQQGYKRVNDRLPKVKQRLHRVAEYRRGIDGRARNNA
ncbi:hypothetical protein QJQ45_005777 [Haematococcus lacustris]|nr:hypothetical protein QJQ45_005777 [Haematococcus lacustris]